MSPKAPTKALIYLYAYQNMHVRAENTVVPYHLTYLCSFVGTMTLQSQLHGKVTWDMNVAN